MKWRQRPADRLCASDADMGIQVLCQLERDGRIGCWHIKPYHPNGFVDFAAGWASYRQSDPSFLLLTMKLLTMV